MTEEELPSGWTQATLADLVSPSGVISDGDWVESKDQDPEGEVRLVQLADIGDGEFRDRSDRWLTSAKAMELACTYLRRGDILIARMPDPIGRACIYPAQEDLAVTVVDVLILRPGNEYIDRRWLMHFVNCSHSRSKIERQQSGTTRKRISGANLKQLEMRLPPANEQRRIVERIDELFSQIEAGEAALARAKKLLERYRQAVLKAAVTGELTKDWRERLQAEIEPADQLLARILQARREAWEKAELEKLRAKGKAPKDDKWKQKYKEPEPPDTIDLHELPEGWVWASLDSVSYHLTSGSRAWKAFYDQGESTFVMAQNVRPGRYDHSYRQVIDPPKNDPETERTRCQIDDILITIVGANTGNTCRFDIDVKDHYICQSVALARPSLAMWSSYFNLYFLAEEGGQAQFNRYIYGAGRPHLSFADLKRTAISFPQPAEMLEITSRTDAMLADLDVIEAELQIEERRAAALRQAILTAAFAGNLVTQDPADEPAAALLDRIRAERHTTPATKPRRGRPPSSTAARGAVEGDLPLFSGHAAAGGDRS